MDNKCSQPPKPALNLKLLPPIDPFRIMNSSSKGKLNNSSYRAAAKVVKPSPNPGMDVLVSDEVVVKNPTLENVEASISSNKKGEALENATSETRTHSADEGMKKGSARSNLYEICAANHWKPPIFECYKQEGPSHQRMFTFKVTIEMEDASRNIIECYGAPHRKKKTAADHAAEGALWYLKHMGYVMLSKLGCQCSEDHAFLGEPLNSFPVKPWVILLLFDCFALFLKIQQVEIIPSSSLSLLDFMVLISSSEELMLISRPGEGECLGESL